MFSFCYISLILYMCVSVCVCTAINMICIYLSVMFSLFLHRLFDSQQHLYIYCLTDANPHTLTQLEMDILLTISICTCGH